MKKYLYLIVLTIFIVMTIGYFYVEVKNISDRFPQLQFEKVSGNEAYVKDLVVSGDLYNAQQGMETLQIDAEGTTYLRQEPFLKRIRGYYPPIQIEEYQKDYRSFMRGKETFSGVYSETDELLVYGSTPFNRQDHSEFEIAVLDKQSKDSFSFYTPIPNRSDYSYIETKEIYLKDNEISFITLNDNFRDYEITTREIHVYTFDIEKQELISDDVIGEVRTSHMEQGYSNVQILMDDQSDDPHIIAIKNTVTYPDQFDDSIHGETVQTKGIIKYHLATKETEEIHLDNEEEIGLPFAMFEDKLFFAQFERDKMKITEVHTETSAVVDQIDIDVTGDLIAMNELPGVIVEDGKMYFVPSSVDGVETTITVVDLPTLEIEYKGVLALSKPLDSNFDLSFYFNDIGFKR